MSLRHVLKKGIILGVASCLVSLPLAALAQPDPATSTCTVTILQGPCPSTPCLGMAPPVARLCPLPAWDRIEFRGVVRDAGGAVLPGLPVKPVEAPGASTLNLAVFTTDVTNALGEFFVRVDAGSGCGRLGVCVGPAAGGAVFLNCFVNVRSPDVAGGGIPLTCPLPTGVNSIVNASDIINPACGFIVKFGLVVPGFNDCYDLNCNGFVNASDVNGTLCPPFGLNGGVLQHFLHAGFLGMRNTCP